MLEIVSEPLTAGTMLADTYRLERVLGEGGMGVVWAARDEVTGRDVALKVLADDRATDPTQQARILREASAAMTIDHPNVVKVSAVLETDAGVPFIVMERLDGESLRAMITRRGTIEPEVCVPMFLGIIDAMSAAHAAGIVHRDLKPENVFLPRAGGVKVLDFGIAKRLARETVESLTKTPDASLTETGAVIGTPYYMAPEQIFGDELDARSDIWSLGIMLYECLSGKRPTEADGFGPILKRIISAEFDPLPAKVPLRLASTTMRMLSRDRAARPSLDDLRTTLSNLDEPSPASLARTQEMAAPPRRSAYAIGFVVLAAAGAAIVMKSQMHPAHVDIDAGAVVVASAPAPSASIAVEPAPVPSASVVAEPVPSASVAKAPVAPKPSAKAPAPVYSVSGLKFGTDAHSILMSASDHQQKREGKECLADLDRFDNMPDRPVPRSTNLDSGYGSVRATCMMLVGDCEEGKRLYRAWIPLHSTPMAPALYDFAAESITKQFCQPRP